MGSWVQLKALLIFGPILALFVVGVLLTLKSGVANISSHQGAELFLGNLSQLIIRLAGYAVGLMAVQRFVGLPIGIGW